MRTNPLTRFAAIIVLSIPVSLAVAGLGGCTYLETQLRRTAPPDNRVKLGWRDRVSLSARELPNYTCVGIYTLTCHRAGSVTYSCTCALP